MTRLTQKDRVLRALRTTGGRGLTRVDFLRPVIDGGAPILNIPARIEELRKEGHTIHNAGRRDECVIYTLEAPMQRWDPDTDPTKKPGTVTRLFDLGQAPPRSPYDTGGGQAA